MTGERIAILSEVDGEPVLVAGDLVSTSPDYSSLTRRYTTKLGADDYFATRLYTGAWDAATDSTKDKAIYMAERLIESVPWRGQPYDLDPDDQPLKWPRVIDGVTKDWDDDEDEAIVPEEIIFAIYEEALALLDVGNSGRQKLRSEGVKSFSISGKISETFATSKDQGEAEDLGFKSPEAYRLVKKWIYRGGPVH